MNNLKKVKFKVAWQSYRVGDEITPNGTLRDWLVDQGFVEVMDTASGAKSPVDRQQKVLSKREQRGRWFAASRRGA